MIRSNEIVGRFKPHSINSCNYAAGSALLLNAAQYSRWKATVQSAQVTLWENNDFGFVQHLVITYDEE